jgi:flagellar basal-body rod modification protein FlgD
VTGTPPVSAPAPASGTTPGTTGSGTRDDPNAIDQDMFLKLLVAQLKYQDPSDPTDPSQFLSQTAQFSTVERLNEIADLNRSAIDAAKQQTATSMIGRTITYTDVSGTERTGTVTGVSVGAATPNLTVDGVPVSLDDVSAVAFPGGTTTSG